MSLIVDVSTEGERIPVSRARVKELATGVLRSERVRDALVSITFVSKREIARLNRTHVGHAGPTDVISFALGGGKAGQGRLPVVGDVYIAPDVARENASRYGARFREEIARLVIHGTLHVLGHDHPDGEERIASPMWKRQEKLLAALAARPKRAAGQ